MEETKESSNQKTQEHKYVCVCTVLVCVPKREWGEAREGDRGESAWERGERGRGREGEEIGGKERQTEKLGQTGKCRAANRKYKPTKHNGKGMEYVAAVCVMQN